MSRLDFARSRRRILAWPHHVKNIPAPCRCVPPGCVGHYDSWLDRQPQLCQGQHRTAQVRGSPGPTSQQYNAVIGSQQQLQQQNRTVSAPKLQSAGAPNLLAPPYSLPYMQYARCATSGIPPAAYPVPASYCVPFTKPARELVLCLCLACSHTTYR